MNTQWRLINYFDVWGNASDGYEVNDLCVEREHIEIKENATNREIRQYLKSIGFITTSNGKQILLSDNGDWIEIETAKGFPLGRLERVA